MNEFYIYEIIRKDENNPIRYIGQRKCPKTKTPEKDNYMGSSGFLTFSKSFIKEHPELFEKRIIVSGLTQEQADRIEVELLQLAMWVPLEAGKKEDVRLPVRRLYINRHPGGNMGNVRKDF